MSVICSEIIKEIEDFVPPCTAESWDNVGLMVGNPESAISKIVFALDCREAVINEAIALGADMIVTHHPFIFKGLKRLDFSTPIGRCIEKLTKNNIAVYSAHTNFDVAKKGTNQTLAELLELENITGLADADAEGYYMGRIGNLKKEMDCEDFISYVKNKLNADRLIVSGNTDKKINKVGMCTGAGSEFMQLAASKGCDAYITGDMKYHDGQMAEDLGLCVIDGSHYLTEVIAMPVLKKYVDDKFKNIECVLSNVNTQTLKIY